jgi:hypothetical protein
MSIPTYHVLESKICLTLNCLSSIYVEKNIGTISEKKCIMNGCRVNNMIQEGKTCHMPPYNITQWDRIQHVLYIETDICFFQELEQETYNNIWKTGKYKYAKYVARPFRNGTIPEKDSKDGAAIFIKDEFVPNIDKQMALQQRINEIRIQHNNNKPICCVCNNDICYISFHCDKKGWKKTFFGLLGCINTFKCVILGGDLNHVYEDIELENWNVVHVNTNNYVTMLNEGPEYMKQIDQIICLNRKKVLVTKITLEKLLKEVPCDETFVHQTDLALKSEVKRPNYDHLALCATLQLEV